MTSRWVLEPAYADLSPDFGSLASVFALEGERITRDSISDVLRVEIAGVRYYVKRYRAIGSRLRTYFRRPRIEVEWLNLQRFSQWGILTASIVAYGVERRCGAFSRGALITRELEGAIDLAAMAANKDPRLADPHWVDRISRELATATRTLHEHRFAHNDLKWRNLLVDRQGRLYFIDCPTGDFWWGPFLERRVIKDLACLDKVAKYTLRRTQRLRFYLQYSGRQKLDASDKAKLRAVLKYFEGRE
ncbi:phosphotransferase [Stutzerimonas stutzeri]|uniref:lipopolysaccharide kinase InaA family protein n=1 Tax=Stutzerimonas sp. S1 TaxID=3030652 RepID=UPI0022242848|nr:lipopolysaccharide kinase InaA family protein [Stutzerimonas sp. S1]MCW3147365.1 phosphotransferase [Stutzerimonas sp. S1]